MPWVRTTEVLSWHLETGFVDMPNGTDLEVVRPTDTERTRLREFVDREKRGDHLVPYIVVEWLGKRRMVPAHAVQGLDDDARRTVAEARRSGR